jgi:hypothetical protein
MRCVLTGAFLAGVCGAFSFSAIHEGIPYVNNRNILFSPEHGFVINEGGRPCADFKINGGNFILLNDNQERYVYINDTTYALETSPNPVDQQWKFFPGTAYINHAGENTFWLCALGKSGIYKLHYHNGSFPTCLGGINAALALQNCVSS